MVLSVGSREQTKDTSACLRAAVCNRISIYRVVCQNNAELWRSSSLRNLVTCRIVRLAVGHADFGPTVCEARRRGRVALIFPYHILRCIALGVDYIDVNIQKVTVHLHSLTAMKVKVF
ncbi:hypothetical protein EVAR_20411_1 [Eumeta japonica]|uniref:Uncharacterized protein n=1 Tax=Eumeta variegata TaxID=151549 RepID=A0A4C1TY06_EUMVA|nr:hypothetical protein EVAR_20411_1 [Eumeta japonica]